MDIAELKESQKKRAAQVVAEAFLNYPMFIHYFPNETKRRGQLQWYMEKTLNCAICYGEALVTPDCSGVMFTLPPGHTRLNDKEFIKNGFLLTPLVMGIKNYAKSSECEKFVADTQEKLMKGKEHYYLWGLVTDPKAQRKGVGKALLKKLTDKADAENMPVYLETHEQNNVVYYEQFGFKLIHTDTIPKHGLDIWCMIRETEDKE